MRCVWMTGKSGLGTVGGSPDPCRLMTGAGRACLPCCGHVVGSMQVRSGVNCVGPRRLLRRISQGFTAASVVSHVITVVLWKERENADRPIVVMMQPAKPAGTRTMVACCRRLLGAAFFFFCSVCVSLLLLVRNLVWWIRQLSAPLGRRSWLAAEKFPPRPRFHFPACVTHSSPHHLNSIQPICRTGCS